MLPLPFTCTDPPGRFSWCWGAALRAKPARARRCATAWRARACVCAQCARAVRSHGDGFGVDYDKMACWCLTDDKEKTTSIADAGARIEAFTARIEDLTAVGVRPNTEFENHEVVVAKNQGALEEATAIREKQAAEFDADVVDRLESISELRAAVTGLSKHNSGSQL